MDSLFNLKDLEKKAFRSTFEDGLWDIFIGIVLLQFVVIPLFINDLGLGDFWSSMVLLPVYIIALWLVKVGKMKITVPRIGLIKAGKVRRKKVGRLILVANLLLLTGIIIGLPYFYKSANIDQIKWFFPAIFCFIFLLGFSAASFLLDVYRFLIYGILIAVLIPVGEILFWKGYLSHHGYPVIFGMVATVVIITGIGKLVVFIKRHPKASAEEINGTI